MLEIIKRTKLLYAVYNFFHRGQLVHNETVLKKLGLHKKYYSSLSSKDFAGMPDSKPGNTLTDQQQLVHCSLFHKLNAADKESLSSFADNGYAVISNYLSSDQVLLSRPSQMHRKQISGLFFLG